MDRGDDSLSAVINMLQRDMEELKAAQSKGIDGSAIYPIGSVITFYDSDDHSNHLGLTWERFATGRMVVGYDSTDASFDTIGATGGEKTHTLTVDEIPSHAHDFVVPPRYSWEYSSGGAMYGQNTSTSADNDQTTSSAGGGQAHNNMPPYVVAALWRRTA